MKKWCFFIGLVISVAASAQAKTNFSAGVHKPINDTLKYVSLRVLPSNYYSCNLGFFCKKELQVQNAVRVPLLFRLGSVAYCDAMEGKNNSHP